MKTKLNLHDFHCTWADWIISPNKKLTILRQICKKYEKG